MEEDESLIGSINSTEVRRRIKANLGGDKPHLGVAGLITPSVLNYIISNNLYSEEPKPPVIVDEESKEEL